MARGKNAMLQRRFDQALSAVLDLDENCSRRELELRVRNLVLEAEMMSEAFRTLREKLNEQRLERPTSTRSEGAGDPLIRQATSEESPQEQDSRRIAEEKQIAEAADLARKVIEYLSRPEVVAELNGRQREINRFFEDLRKKTTPTHEQLHRPFTI